MAAQLLCIGVRSFGSSGQHELHIGLNSLEGLDQKMAILLRRDRGQIWASAEQIDYLVDLVSQVPSLRVVNVQGSTLLTPREEQVVALVAEGLSNRDIAGELALSEHTVKKYLFRIFDKLGISTRVELVLYAVNHGDHRPAEWLPAAPA